MRDFKEFRGKTVLVMGLGVHGGGVGAARFFSGIAARVIVTDTKPKSALLSSLAALRGNRNIVYHLGGHRAQDFKSADYVIKNPGVAWNSEFLKIAQRHGVPVLSDVGIFFEAVDRPIIGVTGTKGKSTTASLIALLLKAKYQKTFIAGNIRKSVLEIIRPASHADYIVLELSSFQLEDLEYTKKSPHGAVITSFAPDHLNRHKTIANYRRIKGIITAFQKKSDFVVIPRGRGLEPLIRNSRAKKIPVDVSEKKRKRITNQNPYLVGHLADAALLALAAAKHLGVPERIALRHLKKFKGLEGRLEKVRVVGGVTFINDTTATAPAAAALDVALLGEKTPVIVIAGGVDKRMPFEDFADVLGKYTKAVMFLPGSATDKILKSLSRKARSYSKIVPSMRDAVREAYRRSEPGDTIVLSPGAASFNLFKHEFDRGEQFVREVKRLR